MNRHAYLLLPYNNPDLLKKLIKLLDDPRNDIYVHVDAKSDFPMEIFENLTIHSKLYVMARIKVLWADWSETKALLNMLYTALNNEEYSYYHFLSGMDLPLKTQDEIHHILDNSGKEFIGIVPNESKYNIDHVRFYYPLLKLNSFKTNKVLKVLNEALVLLQRIIGINRVKKIRKQGYKFYDGWGWCSITNQFAKYVYNNHDFIEEIFKHSKCPDEMVLQTLAMNSEFKNNLHCITDLKEGSMRFIDWERGRPYTWQENDFDELVNSPYLFARKFDPAKDSKIIDMIYNDVMNKQTSKN